MIPLNLVYLRPNQPGSTVDYTRSMEKSGMVTLPHKYLAMYTLGVGPKGEKGDTGATGATGAKGDAGSVLDTIIASCSDELTELTVDAVVAKTHFRAPYRLDIGGVDAHVRASVRGAPVGGTLEIDIHVDGVTIFTTPLTIDATELTTTTAATPYVINTTNLPGSIIPDDALIEVFVTAKNGSYAGNGLKVAITGVKDEL